jgi:hypothetical protein
MSPQTPQEIVTMSTISYVNAMGSLIHAITSTILDIACVVNYTSQFMVHLRPIHWFAIKRIFHYLQGTSTYGLLYNNVNAYTQLEGWGDVDGVGDVQTCWSITDSAFIFGGAIISY